MPDELYGDARQEMKPYYIIIKLPEGEKEEYLLMLPFTPSKKDNMIGWLAARSDLPHYGSLLVYKLPKDKLVYGPMQIEARVDQQPDISRELTLWGQRGSRVIRGNLVAIPISDSFIYVEPVYLEAKQTEEDRPQRAAQQPGLFGKPKGEGPLSASQRGKSETAALPELKRVIVAYGNQVIMEETLDRALGAIFGEGVSVARGIADQSKPPTTELGRLGAQALDHYTRAKGYLREGNWAAYGRELEAMEKVLGDIAGVKENTK
jgi:uncharacterized membrane protein (UPF0182 family)